MKKKSKILSVVLYLLIFILAGFLLWSFAGKKSGVKFYAVMSGSMEPSLKTGSLAIIKNQKNYQVGEVVTFSRQEGLPVTHRIVAIKGDWLETKGDANYGADIKPVNRLAVAGKLIFSLPYLGYLTVAIKTKLGFVLILLLPGLFIIFSESLELIKDFKKRT